MKKEGLHIDITISLIDFFLDVPLRFHPINKLRYPEELGTLYSHLGGEKGSGGNNILTIGEITMGGSGKKKKQDKAILPLEEGRTALLASIIDSSEDAIIGKTLEATISSWNRAVGLMYGYSAEEIVGKPVSILLAPDRPKEMEEILAKISKGERVDHYETLRRRKDGTLIYVS